MYNIKTISNTLKKMIDDNSQNYLLNEPYKVYQSLIEKGADKDIAGALLLCFVNKIPLDISHLNDSNEICEVIKNKCCLNKKMSSKLAEIFMSLYTKDNKDSWKELNKKGLNEFLTETISFEWNGLSIWDNNDTVIMPCHYNAYIEVKPTNKLVVDDKLSKMLLKNPNLNKRKIEKYYFDKLSKKLDDDFEYYCNADDYYEPCVEDFDIEYRVEEWCKANGFKLISCEGEGHDDGFEPRKLLKYIRYNK